MAKINITLDQDEVLQVLGDDSGAAFRMLLQEALNEVLKAESAEQLRALPYERTEERTGSRNGVRRRPLSTRIGNIVLDVPRHRDAPFRTMVFDNYKRSEAALVTTMAEMVVCGVSTARVSKVMETLCGKSVSKQSVSEACKQLDAHVERFLARELVDRYPFVMADATVVKVRENHRVIGKALMIAVGFTDEGRKEVLGFSLKDSETTEAWTEFLETLRDRGLSGVRMFTSDAHGGLLAAVQDVFPGVPWQRCQAHLARNVSEAAPKHLRAGLRSELSEVFNCGDARSARKRAAQIVADYAPVAPKAARCLEEGIGDALTALELPPQMRASARTTNPVERLNREVKRRTDVIGVFPNAGSVMRLAGALLVELSDAWAASKRRFFAPENEELESLVPRLREIARMQAEERMVA